MVTIPIESAVAVSFQPAKVIIHPRSRIVAFVRLDLGTLWLGLLLLFSIASFQRVVAQDTQKKPEPQQQGMGVSTGAAINSSTRRTGGVTDPKAPIVFEDVTAKT